MKYCSLGENNYLKLRYCIYYHPPMKLTTTSYELTCYHYPGFTVVKYNSYPLLFACFQYFCQQLNMIVTFYRIIFLTDEVNDHNFSSCYYFIPNCLTEQLLARDCMRWLQNFSTQTEFIQFTEKSFSIFYLELNT